MVVYQQQADSQSLLSGSVLKPADLYANRSLSGQQ